MTSFYFIRHGAAENSEANTKIYQNWGANMVPLSDEGVDQIKNIAKNIRLRKSEIIITSPFGRALHTAGILSKALNIDFKVETDLHEWLPDINYKYLTDDKMMEALKEYLKNNGLKPSKSKYNYETIIDIKKRIESVLEKYRNYKKVIVVTHGVVIQAFLGISYPNNGEINLFKM